MNNDEQDISIDDILEEERRGGLTTVIGDNGLPEDNGTPITNEPDHDDDDG